MDSESFLQRQGFPENGDQHEWLLISFSRPLFQSHPAIGKETSEMEESIE